MGYIITIHVLAGKITDRKPAFSIHESDCIIVGLTTDDKKGSNSESSRKKRRSETGFFNPSFRLHQKWP